MRARSLLVLCLSLVAVTLASPVSYAGPGEDPTPVGSPAPVSRTDALAALERAEDLFTSSPDERRSHDASRDATLVLRDLAVLARALPPQKQAAARALLARPTDGTGEVLGKVGGEPVERARCTINVCVHWVDSTTDAPPLKDEDGDGVPDWVQTTSRTFEHVWRRTVNDYGYRPPKPDGTPGRPDDRLDVYLADLGNQSLYGYCTTDDPALATSSSVSAFCAVDNDFSRSQYGAPPLESLRVTAAHEFFHAVQFAYDFFEDLWLMEGTAAWIEDELYDDVNDNYQYLRDGPLGRPGSSIDRPGQRYGNWIFWRFLTEYFPVGRRADPTVVRDVWERADSTNPRTDRYSLQAVRSAVAARGATFGRVFADFGAVNRVPGRFYAEGHHYPAAPVARRHVPTATQPATGWRALTLDHLTNQHVVLTPGRSLRGTWRLRIALDLPDRVRGSQATVLVHRRSGRLETHDVRLNRRGNATARFGFTRHSVSRVALSVTNASPRYRCGLGTELVCQGQSRDDDLRARYAARAIR